MGSSRVSSVIEAISHYRIEAELGRGGMGVVYRAHDQFLRRKVAIKLLTDSSADHAERHARILAEARAASALNHPGITTIFEVGEDGDQVFIVMELLSGSTLRVTASNKTLEPCALVRLAIQITDALAAAHSSGVVHGDIKPENIILQPDGRVKLLDFGIARQTAEETVSQLQTAPRADLTPESMLKGTLAYIAPEQYRGLPAEARSDLFSLGVVLHELASGHRPFPGPTATQFMAQILNEPPPPLTARIHAIPTELARIIHKLLEKQPQSRYQSARDLQVDLSNLVRDLEVGPVLPAAVAGKRTVAVLPFKLLTPNPEDEYLSIALADAMANELSSSGELLVRPMSTVLRFTKQSMDSFAAARELNVQVIIEGSIQKFGPRVRVHLHAFNAEDGSTLLSTKFDSEMTDLFGLQDTMAGALSRAIGMKTLTKTEESSERPTQNSQAYELCLRAAERMSKVNRWDTRTAIEMLEGATELDPKFAEAWARLASAQWLMGITFEPGPKWVKLAENSSRRALALDRENSEAQCAKGQVLWTTVNGFQNAAALRVLNHALDINPGNQQALIWKGCILFHVGLLQESKECLLTALAANPAECLTLCFLAQEAAFRGSYEEAQDFYARALHSDPANIWANVFSPMGSLYAKKLEKADESIRNAKLMIGVDPLLITFEALLWAKRGENKKAEQLVLKALQIKKQLSHTHHSWHTAAATYALTGKSAKAVALLRKASGMGLPAYPVFRDDPHFNSMHNDPQFLRLMTDLKKEWAGYKSEFGDQGHN